MTGLLRHLAKFADANRRTAVRLLGAVRTALSPFLTRFLTQKKNTPVGRFLFRGRMTGFEPATFGTTNQRSNQLSSIRHTKFLVELIGLEPTTPCMPCKCSTN